MAIVRELVTLFTFQSEGMNKVEAGVERLKSSIMTLGKLFGIALAADKIYEAVDGLVKAGKEINRLQYQLSRMARSGDDMVAANQELFGIAQRTGTEYVQMLDTYREFLNESKESNVSQNQLLTTVENVYKAFRVGKVSSEEAAEVLNTLNLGFRQGAIPLRRWGLIVDKAPDLVDSLGKSRKELEEMAKNGKLTADFLITQLGKSIPKLNADFAKTPLTIARAFTTVWNSFAKLSSEIWKVQGVTSKVAHYIVQSFDAVFRVITKTIEIFGGLENVITTIGYAAGVAIGLKLIPLLKSGVIWATALALRFVFAAGMIATLTFGIMDLVAWMTGKKSVIGDFVGRFEDVQDFLNAKIQASPYAGAFNGLVKIITELKEEMDKLNISLLDVLGTLFAISVAWKLWKGAKWIGGLLGLTKGKGAAAEIAEDVAGAGKSGGKPGAPKGVGFWGGLAAFTRGVLAPLSLLLATGPAGQLTGDSEPQEDQIAAAEKKRAEWNKAHPGETPSAFGWLGRVLERALKGPEELRNQLPPSASDPLWYEDIIKHGATPPTPVITPGAAATPGVGGVNAGPGATLNNSGNATVNQTNQITIQIDPSLNITDQIRNGITDAVAAMSRQAANAMPITETAKG